MKKLLRLFFELFRISLFVIGGGYAILAVADHVFSHLGWIEEDELLDHLPVFQMVPGIIATHTAVYMGRKVAGWRGVCVGVVAVALPSVIIFTFVAAGFDHLPVDHPLLKSAFVGLRAALTGIIAATIIRSWRRNLPDVFSYTLLVLSVAGLLFGVSVWIVLLAAMAVGVSAAFVPKKGRTVFQSSPLALLLFLKYGLLCFGGGFVLVPMYVEDFVGASAPFLNVSHEEFSNMMALTQMTPGPIGVNGATFFGYRLAGIVGALVASLLLLLPGSALCYAALSSLDRFRSSHLVSGLLKGARPASVALMLSALLVFAKMTLVKDTGSFSFFALALTLGTTWLTMKKTLSPMMLVLLSTLVATAARADEAITRERFPDADVVHVDDVNRVAYRPDGTSVETTESWTKILTEKGRRAESTYSMSYSKRYGTAEIVHVGAIDTNGVERTLDVSVSESTDNSSMSANIFDPLDRNIVCTIPGLKVGETLHIKTRRETSQPRCENVWADIGVFEWTSPMLRSRVEITAPAERTLQSVAIRHPLGNIVAATNTLADGSILYTFTSTNSPQAFPEPDMPALYTQVQHLLVSTARDWPEISRWYWELSAPHIAKTNAAMVAKVEEIVTANPERMDALRAIFRFVSQEIRYMGLTMEDKSPGYAPHDVDITFDNRYGVCRDKAGLLVAMLRLAGFEAYPALINVGPKKDAEVPQPFFNHAIVAVAHENDDAENPYILMDPTNENTKDLLPAYESDKSYVVACPAGDILRTTPTPSAEHNALRVSSRATLEKDGSLFLESELHFNGVNDTAYRGSFARLTEEDRVKFFERVVKAVSAGAELVRCTVEPRDMLDTTKPVTVSLAARFPEMILRGETRGELTIPFLSRALGAANSLLRGSTSLVTRRFDLEVPTTASVDETIEVTADASLRELVDCPAPLEIAGGYAFSRQFRFADGVLTATRKAAVAKTTFSPDDYARLREDLARTEAAERGKVVFALDPLAEADVAWLNESSEVDVLSEKSWVITNRTVAQALTYDGKKSLAERQFSYNPRVESFEILSASVSNLNGTVATLAPHEVNEMDCGWAASAPRYPASKIVVANLPAVEIGSVIDYTYVKTITNAPASFYGEFGFDSREPLARRFVRVNDFSREVLNPTRIPNEPGQPSAVLWRDFLVVSSNSFEAAAVDLRAANDVSVGGDALALCDIRLDDTDSARVLKIRNWMARHIRISGPSLWEIPLDLQLTDPATILKERYATRLDYIRTMTALVRAAGVEADVVFAASDAKDPEELRKRRISSVPSVRAFSSALCRVRLAPDGGFFSRLVGAGKEIFIGTENEYAPLGVCGFEGSTFFDAEAVSFGLVTVPDETFADKTLAETVIEVRETGAVDMTVSTELHGSGVGGFRRHYAEILPEAFSREYQAALGRLSQAATATSELVVETESYPATSRFSCYIPDYATRTPDAISLQLPPLVSSIPTFTGSARRTPFAVGSTDPAVERVVVRFPAGWTEVEHLPEDFSFADPEDAAKTWMTAKVSSRVADGVLEVVIERTIYPRIYAFYAPDYIELVRERSRIASSRANRTLVVRRSRALPST